MGADDPVGPIGAEKVDRLVAAVDRETTSVRQVQSEKLSMRTARQILRDIRRRGIRAGTSLPPEAVMAEDLNVGRGSLREGLRLLEFQGLVSIRAGTGGGPLVGEPTNADFARAASLHLSSREATIGDLAHARLVLEPMLAGLAAENQTPFALKRMRAAIDELKAVPVDRHSDYVRVGSVVNSTIAAMSGNVVLALMSGGIQALWLERIAPSSVYSPRRRRRSVTQYEKVANAIECGDAGLASREMHALVLHRLKEVQKNYPSVFSEVVDWRP